MLRRRRRSASPEHGASADTDGRDLQVAGRLGPHDGEVWALDVSPDGSFVVAGDREGTLTIWELDGRRRAAPTGHEEPVLKCLVSADASYIVSASLDGLRVWEPDGHEHAVFRGHDDHITTFAISPDSSYIVSGSYDGTLRIWTPQGQERSVLAAEGHVVDACAVSPNGSFIVSGSGFDNTLRIWEPDGTPRVVLQEMGVERLAVSSDGSYIVSGAVGGRVRVCDPDGEVRSELRAHMRDPADREPGDTTEGEVRDCAISPDNSYFVTAGTDSTVRIWEADGSERAVLEFPHDAGLGGCAISPDGAYIVTSTSYDNLRMWDPFGHELAVLPHAGGRPAFGPDGSFVAWAQALFVNLWTVPTELGS